MQGSISQGTYLNLLTRVMPRILTIEGYHHMMRDEEEPHFYPEAMRAALGTSRRKKPSTTTANDAWAQFHQSGRYLAYEKFLASQASAVTDVVFKEAGFNIQSGGRTQDYKLTS